MTPVARNKKAIYTINAILLAAETNIPTCWYISLRLAETEYYMYKSRSSESFIKSRVFAWILFSVFWND